MTGTFTERDVLCRIIAQSLNPHDLELGEVATKDPEVLPEQASIAWVLNRMAVGGFCHLPIVRSDGSPATVVAVRDVVGFLADFFPAEILNLPASFGPPRSVKKEGA